MVAYLDRQFPRDMRDLIYVLEQYEPLGQSFRRFDLAGQVEGMTYETAGAYLLGRDVRSNASPKALELVRNFTAQMTDEHHSVVNTVLREENRLISDERREAVFGLIESFRQWLA